MPSIKEADTFITIQMVEVEIPIFITAMEALPHYTKILNGQRSAQYNQNHYLRRHHPVQSCSLKQFSTEQMEVEEIVISSKFY